MAAGDGSFVSEFEAAVDRRHAALGTVDRGLEIYAKFVSRLAAIEDGLGGDAPADSGGLVQMATLADGTLTPSPTAANYARDDDGDRLRAAAERILRDLAVFAEARCG